MDPRIRIHTKISWIRNTAHKPHKQNENKPEGRLHDLPEGADKAHLCEALLPAGQRGDVGIAAEAVAAERATRPHRLERYTSMK
jgi:hypothetical protein